MADSHWSKFLWLWPFVKNLHQIHAEYIQRFLAPFSYRINTHWGRFFFCRKNVHANVARNMFRKNFEPISTALIEQLRSAFKSTGLCSSDGKHSYVKDLNSINIPILLLSGSADLQCPPSCMDEMAARITTSQHACLGIKSGQSEQYGHFDLIVGIHSKFEVWDRVLHFFIQNDTPRARSRPPPLWVA